MATLSFKVTEDEARRIRALARREKLTTSEFLRRKATAVTIPLQKPGKIRCPLTGAWVFAPLAESPALTTAAVRELLADFP